MHEYCVYMLRCRDGSYYTGVTSDIEERIYKHKLGVYLDSYTSSWQLVELVYTAEFGDIFEAIAFEKQVKRWSRRKNPNQALLALVQGRKRLW